MAYYAAILHMIDAEKNKEVRPRHIEYLDELDEKGKIFARGPFADGSGGLVVYIADTFEEALSLAENDPHVIHRVRRLELKEWTI
ncbi:YciI family protein [Metabacillus rhizolycopersici]|uniref:YciI family protein n=1 Tax=Metabacillus rhizolycopersici TaxID=2875709 RepID=A0ABS7UYJ7_9BACI|nr:YciI family protein [Metabacillus rhizolycopersici]MBZ5753405.1 YciI family protein [Metabacillus rhizolycopersici]